MNISFLNNKHKKCLYLVYPIIFTLLTSIICQTRTIAANKTLNLKESVLLGIKNSPELKSIKIDLVKKQIELREAKEAIIDIRRKESTVRFSLLFNIKFPEKHGLPKEIELVMKVPKIENEILELNKKLDYETLNTQYKTENLYMDTVELMVSVSTNTTVLESLKKTFIRIETDYQKGIASKEDLDSLKSEVEKQTAKLQNEILRYNNSKKELGALIGVNVQTGYTFGKDFSKFFMNRSTLETIIDYSKQNDFELFKASQSRKIADRKLQELRNIYNNRWGQKVSLLEQELAKSGEIDYATFLEKYMKTLDNIEAPWKGSYSISFIFFKIDIPKEWFQGELDGIRYFEDQKYALYIALTDRDKAIKEEEKTKNELVKKLEKTYLSVKEFEFAYNDSLKIASNAKQGYEKALIQNRLGKLTFGDLETIKNNAISCENSVLSNLIKYNKALSMFNFYSSGIVEKLKSSKESYNTNQYDSGDSFINEVNTASTDSNKTEWYITVPITEYKFYFGVKIPPKSGITATHFELYTASGEQIGTKTIITETINHLPITFKDSSKLIVKLYNKSEQIYTAEIDGTMYGDELKLQKTEKKSSKESASILGTWEINNVAGGILSRLILKPDAQYAYTQFSISSTINGKETVLTTPLDIGSTFDHLTQVLEPNKIVVYFYRDKKILHKTVLSEDSNNIILIKYEQE